ncbi:MAG TPA: Mur ligase family protein, partial [Prolixibacteraceae bacterium]|nr:Mur ligase family protein [Prolixibacteraceae bacterium]
MISYTVEEVAAMVSGRPCFGGPVAEYRVTRVAVDSRTLFNPEGTLFFALRGVRHDGHQFIGALAERGVRVFVVTAGASFIPPEEGAWIETADSLEALQRLAAFHRGRFSFPVLGITGSNGKTVVKEWLHDLLSSHYAVVRSPKSYNSQTGVPLSVWHMQQEHTLAILEAGISQPGEMEKLERIIRPTLGILTNIGDAHQENFTSLSQKTLEKLKLFSRARQLVFSADQGEVTELTAQFCRSHGIEQVSWSVSGREALIGYSLFPGEGNTTLEASWQGRRSAFTIPFTDDSSIENCCH